MKLLETFRAFVRHWLGLDDLTSRGLTQAREKADRERHAEVMAALVEIKRLLSSPQPERVINPSELDWDTVQQIALHNLEKQEQS